MELEFFVCLKVKIKVFLDPWLWPEKSYKLWLVYVSFRSLSFRPSFQEFSWDWVISCFLKFNMVLGTHVVLTVTEPDFLEKIYLPQKCLNRVFEFIEKMSNYFFLNLGYDESLCYLLYSCINPIFGNQIIWESFDLGQ